jgi:hypothetical protein
VLLLLLLLVQAKADADKPRTTDHRRRHAGALRSCAAAARGNGASLRALAQAEDGL